MSLLYSHKLYTIFRFERQDGKSCGATGCECQRLLSITLPRGHGHREPGLQSDGRLLVTDNERSDDEADADAASHGDDVVKEDGKRSITFSRL